MDARRETTAEPFSQLQEIFGSRLYDEAEILVDSGNILGVRILQGGSIVTGIACTEFRVYIRRPKTRVIEGECSCGERNPCVHIAAVSIAAARSAQQALADAFLVGRAGVGAVSPPPRNAPLRDQYIFYIVDSSAPPRISAWVGYDAGGERIQPENAVAFVPRIANGNASFPRYVDVRDQVILRSLITLQPHGPWELFGEPGYDLLRRTIDTGRAFWESFQGAAIRSGEPRQAQFNWDVLPNGDQRLRCEAGGAIHALLDLSPAVYVDSVLNECGVLELPFPADLAQCYWNVPAIAPEQVPATTTSIVRDFESTDFPRPRALEVQHHALASLRARLVLSVVSDATAHPDAALVFLYNGLPVERDVTESDSVRVMQAGTVHEITRDRGGEQRLQDRLHAASIPSDNNREVWLSFMLHDLLALQAEGWDVDVDDRFPYRIVSPNDWHIDLDTHRSAEWFDMRLGVVVDGRPVNLLPALVGYLQVAQGKSNAAYCRVGEQVLIRLDDGRYLPVSLERIQRIAGTLVELCEPDSLDGQSFLSLPIAQASRLAQLLDKPDAPQLRSADTSLLNLIGDLKNFTGIRPVSAPASFQAILRPYQEEGLGWLQFLRRYRCGGILADDMGLGKTVQALAHLALEKDAGRLHKPSLIVAPVSVIGNWQAEIKRFTPDMKLLILHGGKRKESFAAIDEADVIITSYPLLQLDGEVLLAHQFYLVILDEAQMIKNPRAKAAQAARALRAEHRLCLTGTPMENHLGELWSLFEFLQPGLLGEEKQFQRYYRNPIEKNGDEDRYQALTQRVAPFLLRRTKDAVAPELPSKTQIVELIGFEEKQRDFYDGIRLAMHRRVREIIQQQGLSRSHITMLDALLKLRQVCCDPRLIAEDDETRAIPSAKLEWLSNVLPELVAEGRRILLFSQFTSMLRLIERTVTKLAIPYLKLTGETQHRAALVEQFQTGSVPLFLISLKAGGTGLNLTAADIVIHYDPWWNPAVEAQATDRAHRIGQDKPVFVYKLIAQGTVEEKIMRLQAEKHALATQLYSEKNASPVRMTAADLENLLA